MNNAKIAEMSNNQLVTAYGVTVAYLQTAANPDAQAMADRDALHAELIRRMEEGK